MSANQTPRGVFVPACTPFRTDLSVDGERFVAHCQWLLDEGANGLAVFGTTSEANSLSGGERMAALDQLLAAADHHEVRHYASALGMSVKSLRRACQAGAGLTAKACIARHLTLESKRLLAHTVLLVQSVAHDLGFDEATNFVKFFRKEVGMTPLAFRRAQTRIGT